MSFVHRTCRGLTSGTLILSACASLLKSNAQPLSNLLTRNFRTSVDLFVIQRALLVMQARTMLAHRHVTYVPEEQVMRVSAKLFNCSPAHLPPDLKQNLVGLLRCAENGLSGTLRPGCVHLTLDSLLGREQVGFEKEIRPRCNHKLASDQYLGNEWWCCNP